MRGGKSVESGPASVLRKAGISLLAFQMTWTSGLSLVLAHPVEGQINCAPVAPREQSILVSAKRLVDGDGSDSLRFNEDSANENGAEGVLQPIAKASEYVPDLAEPIQVARIPTLAEPREQAKDSPALSSRLPSDTAPDSTQLAITAKTEVISFHGIMPGISKRINVLRGWGDPRSNDTQASELLYRFDKLPSVEVFFVGNDVDSIVVELEKPLSTTELRERLHLGKLRSVTVADYEGADVAVIYPERGVVLRYAEEERGLSFVSDDAAAEADGARIGQIVIQPIEAEPFLLRAKENAATNLTYAIADLEAALRVNRKLSIARAQLSEIHLNLGQAVTAERYAAEAVEQDPQNAAHRLQWAKCLRHLARYDRAVAEARQVLETPEIPTLLRAQALNEMGLLAALGSKSVARRAMPLHSKAIEIADVLTLSDDQQMSRRAKKLLVEAHLAVAVEISRGAWQKKDETVPQWIERASALAESLIAEEPAYLPLRIQVAVSALAAAANLETPINPLLWIEEAEATVAEMKTRVFDPLAVSQYDWQLGLAYFHGAQIEHRRSEADSALHLGERADGQLSELAKSRDEMPDTAYLMGRLYFQIGAVYAVLYEDHVAACQWYDQAVNRLINPVPVTTMAEPQQHGDALVSMGVSYWDQNERERAIEVTEAGLELIEQAVSSGLLEIDSLSVPYTNLSAMHNAQGETETAERYQQLAREITGTKVSSKPKTDQTERR